MISELNTAPALPPVNAWPEPSPAPTHDSVPRRLATPYRVEELPLQCSARFVLALLGVLCCFYGYRVSQRRRKLVEEASGWMKTVAGLRKTRFKGRFRVAAQVVFAAAAYNLTRMMTLLGWREPELSTA